ncbi:MAG: holo-ACP synthase [Chloroflexi bacterium]|nr:MAG: holo-ACP synthase [Chloroflexota bacterium]
MILRTGIDILEIERLRDAVQRHGDRFMSRIFTPAERAECGENYPSLAARFAAKEAVAKALGTGLGDVSFTDIEILRSESGAPVLTLSGRAQEVAAELKLTEWAISLSHTTEHAVASVVATG